ARQLALDPRAARPIVVTVHVRMLEEIARSDHLLERRPVDEVVFAPMLLALTRGARGVRDGKMDIGLALEQLVHERGLAGARGRYDDEEVSTTLPPLPWERAGV